MLGKGLEFDFIVQMFLHDLEWDVCASTRLYAVIQEEEELTTLQNCALLHTKRTLWRHFMPD